MKDGKKQLKRLVIEGSSVDQSTPGLLTRIGADAQLS
jgi:hypothetical protein